MATPAPHLACLPARPPPCPQWVDGGMDRDWLMGLFGFTDFDAYREPKFDTRSVLAWRDGCLLLSFRGTASKANAVTDIKVGGG